MCDVFRRLAIKQMIEGWAYTAACSLWLGLTFLWTFGLVSPLFGDGKWWGVVAVLGMIGFFIICTIVYYNAIDAILHWGTLHGKREEWGIVDRGSKEYDNAKAYDRMISNIIKTHLGE